MAVDVVADWVLVVLEGLDVVVVVELLVVVVGTVDVVEVVEGPVTPPQAVRTMIGKIPSARCRLRRNAETNRLRRFPASS